MIYRFLGYDILYCDIIYNVYITWDTVMRALIAGVFGAAASSAAWLAFEHAQQANYGWLVCLIGIVTGFCVQLGATGASGGTIRGALAVLLTLTGIVGGHKVYAKIMRANAKANETIVVAPVITDVAETDDDSEDHPEELCIHAEATAPFFPESFILGPSSYSNSAMKTNFSEWDMVWMSLAALVAYITGKGITGKGDEKEGVVAATEERSDDHQDPSENT